MRPSRQIDPAAPGRPNAYERKNCMKTKKILVTVAAVCMIGLLIVAVMKSSLLSIQVIDIEMEATDADKAAVEELSGLTLGQSIFRINRSAVEKAINQSGIYHVNTIQIKYPNEVTIRAEKRTISAAIEYEDRYILVDKNCNVLSTASEPPEYTVLITGINVSQFRFGEALSTKDPQQKSVLIEALTAIEENKILNHIDRIALGDLTSVYLLTPNGVKVNLCEAVSVAQKLKQFTKDELIQALYNDPAPASVTLYKDYFVVQK